MCPLVAALSAERWLNNENASVETVSLDPSKRRTQTKPTSSPTSMSNAPAAVANEAEAVTVSTEKPSATSPVISPSAPSKKPSSAESQSPKTVSPSVASDINITDVSPSPTTKDAQETVQSSPSPASRAPISTPEVIKVQDVSPEVTPSPKSLPKYGGTSVSPYKYIVGKPYHPSQHFQDLRGLSSDKSGTTDLIQVIWHRIASGHPIRS